MSWYRIEGDQWANLRFGKRQSPLQVKENDLEQIRQFKKYLEDPTTEESIAFANNRSDPHEPDTQ